MSSGPIELASRLRAHGYFADDDLATAVWLAEEMHRPLFCEGAPGVGKTSLARALAALHGVPLLRLQCHEGIQAHQALYDWDFPRQVLTMQDAGRPAHVDIWSRDFLLERPVMTALTTSRPGRPAVLLIDEIDRADDEFDALLLEPLDSWSLSVPQLADPAPRHEGQDPMETAESSGSDPVPGRGGTTISAAEPPIVLITSNRTRDVHDALKRRCLYQWLDLPTRERELAIVRHHVPAAGDDLLAAVLDRVAVLRSAPMVKPAGVAETIDWVRALTLLGSTPQDADAFAADLARTLGAVVKHADDLDLAQELLP